MPTPPAPSVTPEDDYNSVAYPGHPYSRAHPSRLETLGRLHGLATAPADRCRVLELGCGDGANLIPLAYLYPGSRFLGVDLAEAPIARGQARIRALGLTNIELRVGDLSALPAEPGPYDYLLAHGVYCWVPPAVADALLRVAGERLAPGGVAYVSYNTYPGHHLRELSRGMMRYHTRAITDPARKVQQAVSLLRFVGNSCAEGEPELYHRFLQADFARTSENVRNGHGNVMYHDELSEFNEPLYFHEFAARAAGHGLRFLCESDSNSPQSEKLSAEATETLRQLASQPLEREQYLDFLQARYFRQTLLRRAEDPLNPQLDPATLASWHVAGAVWEDALKPALAPGVPTTFRGRGEAVLRFDLPLVKAAFRHLEEIWPASLPTRELITAAHARLDREGVDLGPDERPAAERDLLSSLLVIFHGGAIEMSTRPPSRRAIRVSDRPLVSPVARAQLAADEPVANLLHEKVDLDEPLDATLVPRLDGTHDRAALLDALVHAWNEGDIRWPGVDDPAGSAPVQTRELLRAALEDRLEELRRLALLVDDGPGGD